MKQDAMDEIRAYVRTELKKATLDVEGWTRVVLAATAERLAGEAVGLAIAAFEKNRDPTRPSPTALMQCAALLLRDANPSHAELKTAVATAGGLWQMGVSAVQLWDKLMEETEDADEESAQGDG